MLQCVAARKCEEEKNCVRISKRVYYSWEQWREKKIQSDKEI